MLRRKLFHHNHRHHCALYHLLAAGAGAVGTTAFLSPDFVSLLTGFFSSFATVGTELVAGVAGTLVVSAAIAETANAAAIKVAIILFMLISFKVDFELIPIYNNYS